MFRCMRVSVLLVFGFIVLTPVYSAADQLEVRRPTTIYKEPNKRSQKLGDVSLEGRDGPYLLKLVSDIKVNGYYQVKLAGRIDEGWIYKTYVRRYKDQHPKYIRYSRSLYRHWIDEDGDCQNSRTEVLIRDAQAVTFKNNDKCDVVKGTWIDPYTGDTFHEPRQLDVDHVVPLKNAHESGAWTWSRERRQQYANYLTDRNHLLAVKASENRKKGEKGPDKYLPPRTSYHCDYVKIWVRIKQDWELEMTEDEGEAVQRLLQQCG